MSPWSRLARAALRAVPALLGAACGDLEGPSPAPAPPSPPVLEIILSNPITIPATVAGATESANSGLVFLSLPPGSVPSGRAIHVEVERTGAVLDAALVNGGLDPVPISAAAGDTIAVTVQGGSGVLAAFRSTVPPRKPPVVVRTEPKRNRRDVPLNASIQVVFSEPIDAGSLGPDEFSLRSHGQLIAGHPSFINGEHTLVAYITDAPLDPGTDYELVIGAGIRDGDGSALEGGTTVPFTTLPATAGDPLASGPFVVSDIVGASAWISMPARAWPSGAGALSVSVTVHRTGAEVSAPMRMEGLDPIAFEAQAGDTVTASVFGFAGLLSEFVFLVPSVRPPAVIRSNPEPGDQLVPASQPFQLVFSEPIAPTSLTDGSIALLQGGGRVAALLRFADPAHTVVELVPAQPLQPLVQYELFMSDGVRDAGGQRVAAEIRIGFRTAASLGFGGQLAFARDGQLFLVGTDGTGLVQLTESAEGISNESPAWSPDGRRLAFSRSDGEDVDIYILNLEGGGLSRRTFGGYNAEPAWSPDGNQLAFTRVEDGSAGIFLTDANGPSAIRSVINRPGYDASPAWAPDGRRISYTSDWVAYDFVYDLYVVNADGAGIAVLIANPFFSSPTTYFFDSAWSPDGRRLAVAACFNWSYWTCYPNTGIALLNDDGSGFRVIAGTESGSYSGPTWSPDGRTIAFGARDCAEGCSSSVLFVSADGSARGLIVANGSSPAWRPAPTCANQSGLSICRFAPLPSP